MEKAKNIVLVVCGIMLFFGSQGGKRFLAVYFCLAGRHQHVNCWYRWIGANGEEKA